MRFHASSIRCSAEWGFWPNGGRGWWRGLAAASYTCAWPGLASDGPSPGRLAWARQRTEHSMVQQGTEAPWGMEAALGMAVAAWQIGAGGHAVRREMGSGARNGSSMEWERMRHGRTGESHSEQPRAGEGSGVVFFY